MRPSFRGALCGLALGIVAGALPLQAAPLPLQQLKTLKAQESQRAALALGESPADDFEGGLIPQLGIGAGNFCGRHD